MRRPRLAGQQGFTLLEVLIAFAILSIAVVSLIELTSQGLRLLKLSGDHQQAIQLADRIARETQVSTEETPADDTVDTGEEGNFTWERRIVRMPLPEELEPKQTVPGKELPGLYTVSVAVRWGSNHSVEVATLRAPTAPGTPATTTTTDQTGQQGQQGQPGQPGQQGQTGGAGSSGQGQGTQMPGRSQTGPFNTRDTSSTR